MGLFRNTIAQYSDERLMAEVIDHHSHAALTELHRRYSRKLLGYCIRMLQNEALARDIVQEVFLRILEKKHLFDRDKKFCTWAFTIASNLCKTSWRHGTVPLSDDGYELRSRLSHSEDLAEKERFRLLLQLGLEQLEPVHKTAFVLRYMEQFSLNEIAEITDTLPGTVKSRLFYATKKMTAHLKAYDPTYETTLFKLS